MGKENYGDTGMRWLNAGIYLGMFVLLLYKVFSKNRGTNGALSGRLKNYGYLIVVLAVFNTISFVMTFHKQEESVYIAREGYAGGEQSISVVLIDGDQEQEGILPVERRRLTKEEQEQGMEAAFAVLYQKMKGQNPSWERIETDLDFGLDQEKYPFDAEFVPENYRLINGDGYVMNEKEELMAWGYTKEELEKGIATKVTVTLWYGESSQKKEYSMTVFPRKKSDLEQRFDTVMEALKAKERESVYEEGFWLPLAMEGVQVYFPNRRAPTSGNVLLMGLVFVILLFFREQEKRRTRERKIQEQLRKSYPWFVNEMLLLLGAGMQVKHIFSMMILECGAEMEPEDDRGPLIKEIAKAKYCMDNGMSEQQAYYQLGRRLKLPCFIKLMTLLEQNVTKGTKGLLAIFETEEMAALEERKNMAKRYGEEAGTKLLGPMVLLLIVVMLIIMMPAFLSFA